ncbi:caspase-7 [Octopus bimaculoides]|uniref:Caspase family p20 domain-containing protein n=1 Tax=Octopus bimaculoides TaxID=37653 RepID=A0A0L8GEJ3_OCTBM|nr:caspase-7 [Octopus bimaculoides]|eukprot:XP_014782017.1 PREDICTED: caspase-3-like [Octopus bimaculoides]
MDAGSANVRPGVQPPSPFDLSEYSANYDMDAKKERVAYIFNNKKFIKLGNRESSSKDTRDFKAALIELGFSEGDITVKQDNTADEMLNAFKGFKDKRYINIGCFICAIMSHGGENEMISGSDEQEVGLHELLSYLTPEKCPSLSGVPKLIFVQACRGKKKDEGVHVPDGLETEVNETLINIPIMPDLLVFHSSYNEHTSYRHSKQGSKYMQALSKFLIEYGTKYEILTLLTAVSNYVASSEFDTEDKKGMKQMPQIMSTLLKQLKFEPRSKKEEEKEEKKKKNLICLLFSSGVLMSILLKLAVLRWA